MATKRKLKKPEQLKIKIEFRITPETLYKIILNLGVPIPPKMDTYPKFKKRCLTMFDKIPRLINADSVLNELLPVDITGLDKEEVELTKSRVIEAMNMFLKNSEPPSGSFTKQKYEA